jgi:hypothetical protein
MLYLLAHLWEAEEDVDSIAKLALTGMYRVLRQDFRTCRLTVLTTF